MNGGDWEDDDKVADHLKARLNNVGAMFKGATFGLFNVPRDIAASLAVRTEATLLSMRRGGQMPGNTNVFKSVLQFL